MANIVEWVAKTDRSTRGKPSKPIQRALFEQVKESLQEGTISFEECVAEFCRFNQIVIEPFYTDCYATFSDEWKKQWDKAVISWADNKKVLESASIRMPLIVKSKLILSQNVEEADAELRWISLHDDGKTAKQMINIRENSENDTLLYLLKLDMSSWKVGKYAMSKIFSAMFSKDEAPEIKDAYQSFLARNNLEPAVTDNIPAVDREVEVAVETIVLDAASEPMKVEKDIIRPEEEKTQEEPFKAKETKKEVSDKSNIKDGEALVQALSDWMRTEKAEKLQMAATVSNQSLSIKKLTQENEELVEQLNSLEDKLLAFKKEKESVEKELETAHSDIATLQEEKAEAEDTIGRVQVMSGNSVKQELDGFKSDLAAALKKTVRDYRSDDYSDVADSDKAEIYAALIEEMIDTLKHHDIAVEDE